MNDNDSLELLNRFQGGDEFAAGELFDRYVGRLIALAGSRLSETMKRRVGAEDIVQSVYRSFFLGAQNGRFEITESGQLWGLLAAITINKVRDQAKFHTAQKRTVSAEQSMTASRSCYGLVPSNLTGEPTIDEALALEDLLRETLESLPDQHREILELYLQNQTNEEIAKQIRRSTRTVRRAIEDIKNCLTEKLGIEG